MEKLTVLSLFSGIGGWDLGLERTGGFRTVRFCEIDPFCRKVLAKHWPNVPCHDDVQTMQFERGEADVIAAGWPCQDLSFAGKGAGLAGERSGLWREVVRAADVVRPAYLLLENVAALLSRGLGAVLRDLASLGYDAVWNCIPASAVGAPHRRDRIWIVAYPGGEQHQGRGPQVGRAIAAELSRAAAYASTMYGQEIIGCEPHGDHAGLEEMADTESAVSQRYWSKSSRQQSRFANAGWWSVEPDVDRVASRVPLRVDRLRSLGNSLVPQIPEIIGRAILSSTRNQEEAA